MNQEAGAAPGIISSELWARAHAQLEAARAVYRQAAADRGGRPVAGTTAKYLLAGLSVSGLCGGSMNVQPRRSSGRGSSRRLYAYQCTHYRERGAIVCQNASAIPVAAPIEWCSERSSERVIAPSIVTAAIEMALEELTGG
jgi:recombinase-like zinc beta ribbon protein